MIKMIVAMDKNQLIGKDGKIPWYNKEDLIHFKNTTLNQTILMGKVTFTSLPKILPNRKIIVLTHDQNFKVDDVNVKVVHDLSSIIEYYHHSEEILYVAGGAAIYELMLPYASELIVSIIDGDYQGDRYFPQFKDQFILSEETICPTFRLQVYKKR